MKVESTYCIIVIEAEGQGSYDKFKLLGQNVVIFLNFSRYIGEIVSFSKKRRVNLTPCAPIRVALKNQEKNGPLCRLSQNQEIGRLTDALSLITMDPKYLYLPPDLFQSQEE